MKQLAFPGLNYSRQLEHGGLINRGKRKNRRPLCTKSAIHVVLRSNKAQGTLSLRNPKNFFRTLAGVVARKITKAKRGQRFGKFWEFLLYSRVISWGRDYNGTKKYVVQNRREAEGVVEYKPRTKKRDFNTS